MTPINKVTMKYLPHILKILFMIFSVLSLKKPGEDQISKRGINKIQKTNIGSDSKIFIMGTTTVKNQYPGRLSIFIYKLNKT